MINLDEEEWDTQNRAIRKAAEAFNATLEEENYDPGYWSFKMVVRRLSADFDYVLSTTTYDTTEHKIDDVKHD